VTTIDPTSSGITAFTAPSSGSASSPTASLDSQAFLKLMVAQMRYQNPLEPSDPGQMMLQTAQFTQLETMQEMVKLQQRDIGLQEAVMAAGLVGDEVTANGPDGPVSGLVEGIRYTTAGPVLDLGGTEVALGDVTAIRRASTSTTA
jgi:flagellar basal-body rod modification protein FlgD